MARMLRFNHAGDERGQRRVRKIWGCHPRRGSQHGHTNETRCQIYHRRGEGGGTHHAQLRFDGLHILREEETEEETETSLIEDFIDY